MVRFLSTLTLFLVFTSTAGADEKSKVMKMPEPRPLEPAETGQPQIAKSTRHSIQFKNAPWEEVLNWYAEVSGNLLPILTYKPTGTFTFNPPTPDKQYTIAEITDIFNEALMEQKLILVRRRVSFTLVRSDEKLDKSLLSRVDASELGERGESELVQVRIPMTNFRVKDLAPALMKQLSPLGSISILESVNCLEISDHVGIITKIARIVKEYDNPKWGDKQKIPVSDPVLRKYSVFAGTTDAVAKAIGQQFPDLQILAVPSSNEILVLATAEEHAAIEEKLQEIIRKLKKDEAKPGSSRRRTLSTIGLPELRKYPVPEGTATAVLKAIKQLSPDIPEMLAVTLAHENGILLWASEEEHAAFSVKLKAIVGDLQMPEPKK